MNRLISEGLLRKGKLIKGKIGQPSTTINLNNGGALAIGIKIGRRSADIILVGLASQIESRQSLRYKYPDAKALFHWIKTKVNQLAQDMTKAQADKLIGIGVATPFNLDGWEGVINAPKGAMSKWKDIDITSEIERLTGQKTFLLNDATAACLAELRSSQNRQNQSFLYFYVGTFLGGGIVLNGKIYNGTNGNAGSIGSMPIAISGGATPSQMVNTAAIHTLETMALEAGLPRDTFEGNSKLNSLAEATLINGLIRQGMLLPTLL